MSFLLLFFLLFRGLLGLPLLRRGAMLASAAAPDAPKPNLKMNKGSSRALRPEKASAQRSGVAVSPSPRKMPLTASHSVVSGELMAHTRR